MISSKQLKWTVYLKNNNEIYETTVFAKTKEEALSLGESLIKNESFGLLGWQIADITLKP